MNQHFVVDLQGRKLGILSSGKVTNEKGEMVFRLSGNSLSDIQSGRAYTVTPDGRIIDRNMRQFGFVYDYPHYTGRPVDRKLGKRLVILLIVLAAVFLVYHSKTGIVGTWVPSGVTVDGRHYSYSEYQRVFNDYHTIEFHFYKDGTLATTADGRSVQGRWYERWKNNYEIYFFGESSHITMKNGELIVSMDDVIISFRKKII